MGRIMKILLIIACICILFRKQEWVQTVLMYDVKIIDFIMSVSFIILIIYGIFTGNAKLLLIGGIGILILRKVRL